MFDKTFVSFPGLGIEEMELNKIVFTLLASLRFAGTASSLRLASSVPLPT